MPTIIELRETLAASYSTSEEFSNKRKAGTLTDQDRKDWDSALDAYEGARDALAARGALSGSSVPFTDTRGAGSANDPETGAFRTYIRHGDETGLQLRAAQGVGTGSGGGYTVPAAFRATVTETLKAFGGVRKLAEIVTTDDGAPLPWPTNDDTGNEGTLLTENTAATETGIVFGQKELAAHTYTSDIVRASLQFVQDTAIDVDSWLAKKLGQRIARKQSGHWLTGLGTPTQPQGLITGITLGKATASASAITYDELVDLQTSVDPAYLEDDPANVGWLMSSTTLGVLRKLKDLEDRPLIQMDARSGAPTSLLGFRIVLDQGMPAIAATAKPIVFGNVKAAYVIRDVGAVSVLRMVERYGEYLQVGFLGYQRSDGLVQDASAAKYLQMHS